MKTRNKLYTLAAIAGLLVTTNALAGYGDGTISIQPGVGNAAGGGAFTATTTPEPGKQNLGNFYTFCIEYTEHIAYGSQYSYVMSSAAVKGGWSTAPDGTATSDPISIGTAYLYSQWRSGAIANTGANANLLQAAIWVLEGESTVDGHNNGLGEASFKYTAADIAANPFLTGAGSVSALFGANANLAAAPGSYGVVILNVYDLNHAGEQGYARQDQLGSIIPEPSTYVAGALLLLPFCASTLRILRKNRAA